VDLDASRSSSYTVSSPQVFGLRPQPAYSLFDLAVRHRWPAKGGWLSLGLVARNLTDAHPYETLVGDDVDTALRGRVVGLEMRADF
jgi:outer membrane receptor protein involved in Fe transport